MTFLISLHKYKCTFFLLQLKKLKSHSGILTEKDIYNVIREMCRFIHHEVCHKMGKNFHDEGAWLKGRMRTTILMKIFLLCARH